jgi:hypothetical protein
MADLPPFAIAPYADSLVSALGNSDHNPAGSALRQAMSAASAIEQLWMPPPAGGGSLTVLLPVLVTAGELVAATLNPTGDIEVEDVSHVFVGTPRPGRHIMDYVHVMTFDYFAESFAPGLDSARQAQIFEAESVAPEAR